MEQNCSRQREQHVQMFKRGREHCTFEEEKDVAWVDQKVLIPDFPGTSQVFLGSLELNAKAELL